MEHAQNTRIVLASAVVLIATAGGLTACASALPGSDIGRAAADHHALVRASAERYVEELTRRAKDVEAAERSIESRPNLRQLVEADRPPVAESGVPSVEQPRNRRQPVESDRPPAIAPDTNPSAPKGNLRQQMESDRAPAPTPGPPLDIRLLMEADRMQLAPRLGVTAFG